MSHCRQSNKREKIGCCFKSRRMDYKTCKLTINLVYLQELTDLSRDPPTQCSAGPVGDDSESFYSSSFFFSPTQVFDQYIFFLSFGFINILFPSAVFHWQATIMGPVSISALQCCCLFTNGVI